MPYELMVFSSLQSIKDYFASREAHVLITNDDRVIELSRDWNVTKIIKLSEERILDGLEQSMEFHPIFKYQSTELIVKEMLAYCEQNYYACQCNAYNALQGKIIAVYSPIGRCGKTLFSLALAESLAQKGRVLYINLEEYTGINGVLDMTAGVGLSEIMYLYRRASNSIGQRIRDIVVNKYSFDYIPPVSCPDDVVDVLAEEWSTFLEYIAGSMGYDYIVVDLGNLVSKPWNMFGCFDVIFMPELSTSVAQGKIHDFYNNLCNMGRQSLEEKIVRIEIPYDQMLDEDVITMEKIQWSIVGNFARKVVNERDL